MARRCYRIPVMSAKRIRYPTEACCLVRKYMILKVTYTTI
jgi:hypothetical protein